MKKTGTQLQVASLMGPTSPMLPSNEREPDHIAFSSFPQAQATAWRLFLSNPAPPSLYNRH